jgi:hypothetical protein
MGGKRGGIRAAALSIVVACAAAGSPAAAAPERWAPPGIVPVSASAAAVLAHAGARDGSVAGRIEHVRIVAPPQAATATVEVRGRAYRATVDLDGHPFAYGVGEGIGWRRLPSGLTHVVRSDLQGDELDRWPRAVYGFDIDDCRVEGRTRDEHPLIVIRDAPAAAPPHWFFVDPASGEIVREMQRDGIQVATFTFSDWRETDGARRPYRWHIAGGGPDADVVVDAVTPAPAGADIIPVLADRTEYFRSSGTTPVPATFADDGTIVVPVVVNGRAERFELDDGTTEITMDTEAAAHANLTVRFGHAIAGTIDVNGIVMHDVPVLVVPDLGQIGGLLGNDFFVGHVVHVDYAQHRVEVVPRDGFTPPAGTNAIPMNVAEGLPIVSALIGSQTGTRFALDLGSYPVLLGAPFFDTSPHDALGFRMWSTTTDTETFLEGPVRYRAGVFGEVDFAGAHFTGRNILRVEQAQRDALALPFDGILGTRYLEWFDLWFDYSGGVLYARPL